MPRSWLAESREKHLGKFIVIKKPPPILVRNHGRSSSSLQNTRQPLDTLGMGQATIRPISYRMSEVRYFRHLDREHLRRPFLRAPLVQLDPQNLPQRPRIKPRLINARAVKLRDVLQT